VFTTSTGVVTSAVQTPAAAPASELGIIWDSIEKVPNCTALYGTLRKRVVGNPEYISRGDDTDVSIAIFGV